TMNKFKEKELQLLSTLCSENKIPTKLAYEIIKSAVKFSYENLSPNARKKEYFDLIDFYSKKN
ncbi:hypothetical protein, partial [Brevibacillus agri]|uniref:hypothetical protein n=1 Tax=Brevibacillus agri TaxID=51101 RepID=UPI0027D9B73F